MARGLPKSYIKKYGGISKKAWAEYRKSRKGKKTTKKSSAGKKRSVRKMVRRKKSRRRSFFSTASIFKYLRIGALIAPGAYIFSKTSGTGMQKLSTALQAYAGIKSTTGKFDGAILAQAWIPFLMSNLVTLGIGKLNGIIRRL